MENKASMTSLMSAFGRAYHNAHARDPIFRDTMAGELMTDAEYHAIGGYILSGIDFFAPDKKGTFRDDDDALLSAGYNPKKKTFFSWLGVSMYLDRTAIEHLLDEIAAHAPKGSSLVFDYASAALFLSEDRRVQNMLAMAQAGGEAMRSSFDPMSLERMAGDHGFLVYEHLMTADIQKRYFANRDDDLSAFPCICFAHAVVQ